MADATVLRSSSINRTPNKGSAPNAQLSGALPVVNVNMNNGGPQQHGQGMVRQGVTLLPPKGGTVQFRTGGLPNQPATQSVTIMPPKDPKYAAIAAQKQGLPIQMPTMSADQLMLCRHAVDKYAGDLRTAIGETQPDEATAANLKLAEDTIATIDLSMVAITSANAAAEAAAEEAARQPAPTPTPVRRMVGAQPAHGAATAVPRRVARPAGGAPPPVVVKMDAGQPVLQPLDQQQAPVAAPQTAPTQNA